MVGRGLCFYPRSRTTKYRLSLEENLDNPEWVANAKSRAMEPDIRPVLYTGEQLVRGDVVVQRSKVVEPKGGRLVRTTFPMLNRDVCVGADRSSVSAGT